MARPPGTSQDMKRTASLIIPLSALLALADCGSYRTSRRYGDDGALRELLAYRGMGLAFTIHYEYDAAGRTVRMRKLSPSHRRALADCSFYYDQMGRLKMFACRQTVTQGGRSFEDSRVESFYYNASGGLIRTEASYKSAYSIALNKSPLSVIDYHWAGGKVQRIMIAHGLVAGEATLAYDGREIDGLEYRGYTAGREGRALAHHIRYSVRGAGASSAKNLLRDGPSLSRKRMMGIFREEKLADALDALLKAGNTPLVIREIENGWLK